MMLPGWCSQCRRLRQVRVTRPMPGAVQTGICRPCQEEADSRRNAERQRILRQRDDRAMFSTPSAWPLHTVLPLKNRRTGALATLGHPVCRRCGTAIEYDGLGAWLDASDGDGCDSGVHEPRFWLRLGPAFIRSDDSVHFDSADDLHSAGWTVD